jgi:5-methylthioribose kinase
MSKVAPFDEDGNMVSWPQDHLEPYEDSEGRRRYRCIPAELTPVEPFHAEMAVVGMETGRSAKRIVLKDINTGKTYPLFVADIVKLLQGTLLTGTWEACKRGKNYGVRKVK